MIETWHLSKWFGSLAAVDGVTLRVDVGEILALLGPNGAGKTTMVRMLSAILQPSAGKAMVCGYNVVEDAREVRRISGVLTEVPGLYTRMNAVDYLHFFGRLQMVPEKLLDLRVEQLLKRFDLWDARRRPLGVFSKGMKQKVALLRALIHDPQVLYLDEPTSAMDPLSAKTARDFISELRREDRTIIICTHNLAEAEMLADRIAIINRGRIVSQGSVSELKRSLLGPARFELKMAAPLDGVITAINGTVKVEEIGEKWLRYSTPKPESANPELLRRVMEAGGQVVSLNQLEHSLEEVYLKLIEES